MRDAKTPPAHRGERRAKGKLGEELAADFLQAKGLKILARNVRFGRLGELDLVAKEGQTLVFVEVRSTSDRRWRTYESVNIHKRRKLESLANAFRKRHRVEHVPCRLDVAFVLFGAEKTEIRWVRGV